MVARMVQGRATIRDVACKAGVSTATVSRVLNKSEKVHARTRQRVERACLELGYSRDPIATALRTGRSNMVYLLIERFDGNFIPEIMVGIEARADGENYRIIVSKSDNVERSLWKPSEQYIDGIIVIPDAVHDLKLSDMAGNEDIPLVCVYSYSQDVRYPSILPDDFQGAYLAVEHLAAKGCEVIGYIGGIPDWPASLDRLYGYRQAVKDFGLRENPDLIEAGDWTAASGYRACMRLLEKTEFDSVFACNDPMAIGAMDALREQGLEVPGDVAVIGFDNAHLCRYVRPTLTSIDMPLKELGETAMDTLLSLIERRNAGQILNTEHVIKIPCILKERASTQWAGKYLVATERSATHVP
jgi:DNA-binding LacI/PurR family transcriptional regulator